MSQTTPPPSVPNAMAAVADALTSIIELSAGHRARLLAAGFSEQNAQAMSAVVHDEMVRLTVGGSAKRNAERRA